MSKTVKCRDIHNNYHDVPVADLIWRPAVYGIIIRDNKLLLSKEFDGYDFPGGGMEIDESFEDALIREIKEETGYDVAPGKHVLTGQSYYRGLKGVSIHGIQIYFICTIVSGELSTDFLTPIEKEYDLQPEWVDLTDPKSITFMGSENGPRALELVLKEMQK